MPGKLGEDGPYGPPGEPGQPAAYCQSDCGVSHIMMPAVPLEPIKVQLPVEGAAQVEPAKAEESKGYGPPGAIRVRRGLQ